MPGAFQATWVWDGRSLSWKYTASRPRSKETAALTLLLTAMEAYRATSSKSQIVETTAQKPKERKRKKHQEEFAEMKKMAQMSSALESIKPATPSTEPGGPPRVEGGS